MLNHRQFEEARAFVHQLGVHSSEQWRQYCKSGKKPTDIPTNPPAIYKNKGWRSWEDWLGTDRVAPQNKQYRSFKDAREFVRQLGLSSVEDWVEYYRSREKRNDIPAYPNQVYKDKGWRSWEDWLGTGYLKQKLTLGISSEVIAKAKEAGINISELTEQVLKSVIYDQKGNTKGDLTKAYESLFDLAKCAVEGYNTNFEVGVKDGSSILLDYNSGLIYRDQNKPDPAHSISVSEAIPYLLPTKNILENLILATIEGKERNKERLKELQLALRFVRALFDEDSSHI